jgi:adenine deaminase
VAGFADRLDGFATTTSTDFNVLALGRRPEAMARAVNRLLDLHGHRARRRRRIVYELRCRSGAS